MPAGRKDRKIGMRLDEFSDQFNAARWIFQMIEPKFKKFGAILVLTLCCTREFGNGRKTKSHADTGKRSGKRGHETA